MTQQNPDGSGVTPEQLFRANLRRGYNTRWLYNTCRCGHARVEHAGREGCCAAPSCLCQAFDFHEPPPRPGFNFNTVVRASAPPEPRPPEVRETTVVPQSSVSRPQSRSEIAMAQKDGKAIRCPWCHESKFNMIPSLRCKQCGAWQHAACVREAIKCAACGSHWRGT